MIKCRSVDLNILQRKRSPFVRGAATERRQTALRSPEQEGAGPAVAPEWTQDRPNALDADPGWFCKNDRTLRIKLSQSFDAMKVNSKNFATCKLDSFLSLSLA